MLSGTRNIRSIGLLFWLLFWNIVYILVIKTKKEMIKEMTSRKNIGFHEGFKSHLRQKRFDWRRMWGSWLSRFDIQWMNIAKKQSDTI